MAGSPSPSVEGYTRLDTPHAKARVRLEAEDWLASVLGNDETVHEWAARQSDLGEFPGRGRVYSFPAAAHGPDERTRWAVRHYRRGGAMAMHMEDRYLRVGRPRPFRELDASIRARARGVLTPAVMAAIVYPDRAYYRCDLVTEVVPGVKTLATMLHEHDGTRGWLMSMARAGQLIRTLARLGVYHVDLNARNVLMSDDPSERAWVVDLDRARIVKQPSPSVEERMQIRLTRSIVKIGTPTGEHLADGEIMRALATDPASLA